MQDMQWLCSTMLNAFFMIIVCVLNNFSNDKIDNFEVDKYKNQVNKKAKEFFSKYYIGLDSTNFCEEYFESDDNDNFEKIIHNLY